LSSVSHVPIEHFFLLTSQASPVSPSGKSKMLIKMSMEHWCKDTDSAKPKYNVPYCHSFHHKYDTDWAGIETAPSRTKTGGLTAYAMAH
jgi:hypothetical protein